MFKYTQLFVLLAVSLALVGCDLSTNVNVRSGSLEDDYVEEPLGTLAERFEPALLVSNNFIDHLKTKSAREIYNQIFSNELREDVSLQQLQELLENIYSAKGNVVGYKKMQWGFSGFVEDGRNLVGSTKIVEHENGMMKYLLIFDNDGKFQNIVGFHFKERMGASPPGQF